MSTVEASSQDARRLRVSAKSFVIAAGVIESARILLEIDRSTGERMFSRSARIGRYLSDHLSCAIADVHSEDQKQVAKLFGPIFSKGRMRSFRFIETSIEPFLPRHFAHFIFDIDNAGFRLVKDLLFSLQARTLPDLRLSNVIDGINGLLRLAYNLFIKSSLFIPPHTSAHLLMDIEQTPDPTNRVHLGEKTDRFGRPIAVVPWQVNEIDYKNIQMLSQRLLMKWPDRSLGFPRLVPIHISDTLPKPYDAYHPVGTCRIGTDKEATVDLGLRVRGTQNLYVLSTGVFPSAGTANPTFSMLCLGNMLADKLKPARNSGSDAPAGFIDNLLDVSSEEAGVHLFHGTRIVQVRRHRGGVAVRTVRPEKGSEVIRGRLLILATGAAYHLHRELDLELPRRFVQTAQMEVDFADVAEVELYFGNEVAPGSFAWIVPLKRDGRARARIGLMANKDAEGYLVRFLQSRSVASRLAGGVPERFRRRPIPLAPLARTFAERVLVVGDAAGLTKPTTGGGIYYSLLSAELAASVACQALEVGSYSAEFLSQYQNDWKVQLGSELRWGRCFRRHAERLTDAQIDEAFQLATLEPLDRLIRERARFNWHGELIQALVGHGQVRGFLLRVLLSHGFRFIKREGNVAPAFPPPDLMLEETF